MHKFCSRIKITFLIRMLMVLVCCTSTASAVTISEQRVGNVAPFSFDLVWLVSAASEPHLQVYTDSAGTAEISDLLRIEYYPLSIGDPEIANHYSDRIARRSLTGQTVNRGLVVARIHGLNPSTEYHVRISARDGQGNDITTDGPLQLIMAKTAMENAFVSESRLLGMDFTSSVSVEGAVAVVESPGLPYPLIEVVGSGNSPQAAWFNLDNLLDAAGITNLNPSTPLDLEISLLGTGVPGGVMAYTVAYGGGFTTAQFIDTAFSPSLDALVIDTIADQTVGLPFTVTIRALDFKGNILTEFNDPIEVTSNLALSAGSGTAQGFSGGILTHDLTFAESGLAQITASRDSVSGSSNSFTVADVTYQLTTSTSPQRGGSVSGDGVYVDGTDAPIEAIAHPNFLFAGWLGDGVADLNAALTTVSMTTDRFVTAQFIDDPDVIDYEEWKQVVFGQQANDPVITAPGYDFDQDARSNLFEYATGMDPTVADVVDPNPSIALGADGFPVFTYIYNPIAADLELSVMTSTDLTPAWSTYVPDPADVVETVLANGLIQVQAKIRLSTDQPVYVRFKLVLQTP